MILENIIKIFRMPIYRKIVGNKIIDTIITFKLTKFLYRLQFSKPCPNLTMT